ncbi:hypothetical protein B5H70_001008 [Shigella boydii]|nr:hypothetical protein [Shigella boydii]
MKLAYAAEIPFVKKTRGLSPEEYQQRIITKLEPAFVFGGFILPWKGNHTYFRLYNLDTQEYKDYKLRKLEDTNGGELFQTEKAVWLKMESRCNEKGKKFLGWQGEWKGRNKTKARVLCPTHNQIMTPSLLHALKDDFDFDCKFCMAEKVQRARSGKTFDEVIKDKETLINARCETTLYIFKGFIINTQHLKDVKFKTYCKSHNHEWESHLRCADSFTCPLCIKDQLVQLSNRTYQGKASFYIQLLDDKFIKFGITTRKPEERMREQTRKSNFTHRLIFTHEFENGWKAVDLEHEVKQRFKTHAAPYKDFKDGWSETLTIDELPHLQQLVYDYLTNQPDEANMWVSPKDVFDDDTFKLHTHFYGINKPEFFCIDDNNPDLMDEYFNALLDAL